MFSIEIEINVTWFLFDDRSFSTRSEAEAEADLLAAARPTTASPSWASSEAATRSPHT